MAKEVITDYEIPGEHLIHCVWVEFAYGPQRDIEIEATEKGDVLFNGEYTIGGHGDDVVSVPFSRPAYAPVITIRGVKREQIVYIRESQ